MKIGFFDSGLGGLTILKAVAKELPQYDYYFYGDTENLPYGDKTEEEIYSLTKEGIRHLFELDCALVIIACNTASAETARRLQDEFLPEEYPDRKILGIIVPTIEILIEENLDNTVLIGTSRTVNSGKYDKELQSKGGAHIKLQSIATPELVPLIELGELEAAAEQAINRIVSEAGEREAVILGCTHYTQIKNQLREKFGESKKIISQDEVVPNKLKSYLEAHPEIETRLSQGGQRSVHLTAHRPDYDFIMGNLLGGVYVDEE